MSYRPSLFWERLIKNGVPNRLGYTFQKRRVFDNHLRLLAILGNRIRPVRFCLERNTREHLAYLGVFKSKKILADYSSAVEMRNVRSTALTARTYWDARNIEKLAMKHLTPSNNGYRILEIGAGGGMLSVMTRLRIADYQIIDLPVMLEKSKATIREYSGDINKYRLGTPEDMPGLPDKYYDIIISTFALQEMDKEQRDGYIREFYRVGKAGALVYTMDRRQPRLPLRDGSTWDNNPLLYPWSAQDRVLMFQECPIYEVARTKWGIQANISFVRAALINLK